MPYRIKITELYSGKKIYAPQYCTKKSLLSGFLPIFFDNRGWRDIQGSFTYNDPVLGSMVSSLTSSAETEEQALQVIQQHKEEMKKNRLEQVAKTSFKEII